MTRHGGVCLAALTAIVRIALARSASRPRGTGAAGAAAGLPGGTAGSGTGVDRDALVLCGIRAGTLLTLVTRQNMQGFDGASLERKRGV